VRTKPRVIALSSPSSMPPPPLRWLRLQSSKKDFVLHHIWSDRSKFHSFSINRRRLLVLGRWSWCADHLRVERVLGSKHCGCLSRHLLSCRPLGQAAPSRRTTSSVCSMRKRNGVFKGQCHAVMPWLRDQRETLRWNRACPRLFIVELAIGSHSCPCTGSNQYLAAQRLMRC